MKKIKIKTKKNYLLGFGLTVIILTAFFVFYQQKEVKILFVGDMFFDRTIRKIMYEKGPDHIFSCIDDFLKTADVVVGNLEGPITENASVSLLSQVGDENNYTFTFPTQTAKLLAKNNIKVVSLGNNHIGNFGKEGIASTKKYLEEAGVDYFASSAEASAKEEDLIYRTKIKGNRLSFIAYNEFGGESKEKVAEKIKKEKSKGQKVVVFAHWGEEYIEPVLRVKTAAKLFAKSGANFIVGSHPHVIQSNEILEIKNEDGIKKVPVYYSLGNFIFDQYWNSKVSTGLLLEVSLKGDDFNITPHRVSLTRDGTTCLKN